MSEPAVRVCALRKSFGGKTVLSDLSFDIAPGEVIGVLGKNGAGKTTLLEVMLGFTPATSGSVHIFGEDARDLPGIVKRRIGFVPQQDELLNQITVADQLALVASFYPRWDHDLIARLCVDWNVDLQARIKSLSVGERQKLSILLAFGHRPDLLVLDEPVASLDPLARRQFLEQLVELSAEGGRSVIFSSHIVSDIERLASRVWILKGGKLAWEGDLETLKETIVRVHVRGERERLKTLVVPGALASRRTPSEVIAVVGGWTPRSLDDLRVQLAADVEVEPLNLEEIFVELHR
jgi:ABC-2 type transport system ATP-binding protein